jgi:signal transduction histidine kinase
MIAPAMPANETERLKALASYQILDTLSETEYDNLTTLAAQICNTKISLISLIDEKRQWFKSRYGLAVNETPRELAFCAHAINKPDETLIIPDARSDKRFHDNPLVIGHPNIVFYAGVPLQNDDGLALGTLCVLDDKPNNLSEAQLKALRILSDNVLTLFELRKKKHELEQSLISLETKNAKLESFAMIAAHDIKAPIRNVMALSNILLEDHRKELNTETTFLIEHIQKATIKLSDLVDALLQFAKSTKSVADSISEIDVESFCKELKLLLQGTDNLQLNFQIEATHIYTNITAFTQILINLISNAIKYNYKTEIKVDVCIKLKGDEIYVSVKDNGEGIAPEYHEKIFECFRVMTNKDRFGKKGHGIGLASVKEHVELLGGKIWLKSEPKVGSTFYFTLKNQVSG